MKRKSIGLAVIIILSLAASVFAAPPLRTPAPPSAKAASASPRSVFQDLYNTSDAAANLKDMDGYLSSYMQDYKLTEPGNKVSDLEDIRYRLGTLFNNAQSIRSATSVTSAAVKGSNAIVMVKTSLAMRVTNPDNDQKFIIFDRIVCKDFWVNNNGMWMIHRSQIVSEQNTANGKPITDKSDPFSPPKPKHNTDDDDNSSSSND